RQQAALDAHRVDVPPPPQRFRLPALRARNGTRLVRAEDVRVDRRLSTPVSLAIEGGDRLLVTGANGAGKSTLLVVLAGDLPPTDGTVHRTRDARIALVGQE